MFQAIIPALLALLIAAYLFYMLYGEVYGCKLCGEEAERKNALCESCQMEMERGCHD